MDPAGTLLLHRVDELPAEIQVQLVELLARRLAHRRPIVTAAAPLAELARRGTFHAELAAQLSTITIELPPLAARRDDLPLLAQLFLEDRNAAGSRQIGGFSQAALDRLDAYGWPGNLDELAAVVAEAHAPQPNGRSTKQICPSGFGSWPRRRPIRGAPKRRLCSTNIFAAWSGN